MSYALQKHSSKILPEFVLHSDIHERFQLLLLGTKIMVPWMNWASFYYLWLLSNVSCKKMQNQRGSCTRLNNPSPSSLRTACALATATRAV